MWGSATVRRHSRTFRSRSAIGVNRLPQANKARRLRNGESNNRLTDIDGIGPEKAKTITNRLEQFW
jgi:hypothetical protein